MWIALQRRDRNRRAPKVRRSAAPSSSSRWACRRPSRSVNDSSYLLKPRTRRWGGCAPACSPAPIRFDLGNHQYLEIIAETSPGIGRRSRRRTHRSSSAQASPPPRMGPEPRWAWPARSSCRSVDVPPAARRSARGGPQLGGAPRPRQRLHRERVQPVHAVERPTRGLPPSRRRPFPNVRSRIPVTAKWSTTRNTSTC